MNGHPRLVPWKSSKELQVLKSKFFPTLDDVNAPSKEEIIGLKKQAITKTLTYQLKAAIPHSLLSTAHLTSIQLRFQQEDDEVDESLQLMSTMALIRFVNGLLDPSQQSSFAIPLSLLAKKIGLPSWFVEVRHAGTHDSLPSLEMLELSVNKALQWLYENYWGKLIQETEAESRLGLDEQQKEKNKEELKIKFKEYRRIRKLDINKEYKQNDTSDDGKEYWKTMKGINELFQVDILLSQIIPGGKLKFEKVKQMYEPLLDYLLKNDQNDDEDCILELLEFLILKIYQHTKFNDESVITNKTQLEQAKSWSEWIVLERIKLHNEDTLAKIVDIVSKFSLNFNSDLLVKLQNLKKHITPVLNTKINNKKKLMKNLSRDTSSTTTNQESPMKRPLDFDDIDDIADDLENLKRKFKLPKKDGKPKITPFQTYPDWSPKPFGVI